MTKILVNAEVLQKIFEKHPEVEVELVKNGAAQVAERLRQRIMETTGNDLVQKVTERINQELNKKYNMPPAVIKTIEELIKQYIQAFNATEAEKMAKRYFDEAFAKHSKALESKIDNMATDLIQKKINAVFAQAAKLK